MKILKKIFVLLWSLPQFLLGRFLLFIYRKKVVKREVFEGVDVFYIEKFPAGISLYPYIILNSSYLKNYVSFREMTIKHEYGHCRQSLILGWLYLIVVGIPSISMNILSIISRKFGKGIFANNYYKRWPESWADRLGGVKR